MSLKKAILRTLAYADVFDYPLSAEEIHSFLIRQNAEHPEGQVYGAEATPNDVKKELAKKSSHIPLITFHDGFYCLKGRQAIVAIRKEREEWSEKKLKIARRVAEWWRLIPWVKLVAVTGTLAMENSDQDDDIDLLIITAKNRLWLCRGFIVSTLRFFGLYRRPGRVKDMICPNMFLDETHLRLPKRERNLFTAHEVCQLKPLWNRGGVYEKFIEENKWVEKYLPNAMEPKNPKTQKPKKQFFSSSVLQFLISLADLFERLAYRAQLTYMRSRRTTEIAEAHRIRFHPQDCRQWVLKEYQKKILSLDLNLSHI